MTFYSGGGHSFSARWQPITQKRDLSSYNTRRAIRKGESERGLFIEKKLNSSSDKVTVEVCSKNILFPS